MKYNIILAGIAALSIAGCVIDAPSEADIKNPGIRLDLSNGAAGVIQSPDTSDPNLLRCIRVHRNSSGVHSFNIAAIISDSGGLQNAVFIAKFGARIDADSISVAPEAPDITWNLTDIRAGDTITGNRIVVTLTPPEPGRVRTGVTMQFKVSLETGAAGILFASARDRSGNSATLDRSLVDEQDGMTNCLGD